MQISILIKEKYKNEVKNCITKTKIIHQQTVFFSHYNFITIGAIGCSIKSRMLDNDCATTKNILSQTIYYYCNNINLPEYGHLVVNSGTKQIVIFKLHRFYQFCKVI